MCSRGSNETKGECNDITRDNLKLIENILSTPTSQFCYFFTCLFFPLHTLKLNPQESNTIFSSKNHSSLTLISNHSSIRYEPLRLLMTISNCSQFFGDQKNDTMFRWTKNIAHYHNEETRSKWIQSYPHFWQLTVETVSQAK